MSNDLASINFSLNGEPEKPEPPAPAPKTKKQPPVKAQVPPPETEELPADAGGIDVSMAGENGWSDNQPTDQNFLTDQNALSFPQTDLLAGLEDLPPLDEEPAAPAPAEFVIFKLRDTKKKGRVHIDGCSDQIMNPRTKKRERIWLLNGAHSIWQSELMDLFKAEPDYVKLNRRSLTFEGGVLRVPVFDERALEFIEVCHHFVGSPNYRPGSKFEFIKYDPEAMAQAAYQRELLEIKAVQLAERVPEERMRHHAAFLGVTLSDELGLAKSARTLRTDYMLAAKRDPARYHATLNSPEVEVQWRVRRAISDSRIDLQGGRATWQGGHVICALPAGVKATQYLTELALTNSAEGRRFLQQLQTIN